MPRLLKILAKVKDSEDLVKNGMDFLLGQVPPFLSGCLERRRQGGEFSPTRTRATTDR